MGADIGDNTSPSSYSYGGQVMGAWQSVTCDPALMASIVVATSTDRATIGSSARDDLSWGGPDARGVIAAASRTFAGLLYRFTSDFSGSYLLSPGGGRAVRTFRGVPPRESGSVACRRPLPTRPAELSDAASWQH